MYKKNIFKTAIFVIAFLFVHQLEAQRRFKAGAVAGINVAQIRGDQTGGFNKFGLVAGLRVITILKDKMDLSMELVYSQRGSRANKAEQGNGVDVEIDLNYVEVPILFSYKDWYQEGEDYYKVQASGGFSYSRLISAKSVGATNAHIDQVNDFNQDDFSLVLGIEYFFSPNISLAARWNNTINLLYDNEKYDPDLMGLRPHFLSFRLNYLL